MRSWGPMCSWVPMCSWERRPRRDEGHSKALTLAILLICALLTSTSSAAEPLNVTVEGLVLQPGTYSLPEGARLSDASVAAQVRADAWFLGAALLRRAAIQPQQKLKAGLLFDLQSSRVHWQAEEQAAGVELAGRLLTAVEAMPVTGRVRAQLDPLQQLALSRNGLLQDGDRIAYPPRAERVRVTGAVKADCLLAFDPSLQPVDYLDQCPRHALADPSYVHVVQPDGRTQRRGVALWNREPGNVAVGAVLYVPVDPKHLAADAQGLNDDFVALLATQVAEAGAAGKGLVSESAIAAGAPLLPGVKQGLGASVGTYRGRNPAATGSAATEVAFTDSIGVAADSTVGGATRGDMTPQGEQSVGEYAGG
ncbi:capsule biosynthesis GfcC family protein [Halopseudomonas nanhaiensis]|uniref:capsule biosynthesis GfcC family protein n=1 Tax=Halopseudomonas nanhaiensis TaxID=2830842 RepID=UPI001CBE0C2A|nr:capsule biosynthesis GfcC family protein [Halopseudomonas nanhaiensis]UAW99436.1 capsule biosynthesis GfcC family protein [Halopseudomonas nanhaiensis]